MTSVDIFRHAQSRANIGIQERNSSITPYGSEICKTMTGEYDLVICSVLKRSQQTLNDSCIKYRDCLVTPLCREYIEGDENGNVYISNLLENETVTKAETIVELGKRINDFIDLLKKMSAIYPRIAVISHAGFINLMTRDINYLDNCGKKTFKII